MPEHNLRINLFGGPGCGKSTLASLVFGRLKLLGCSTEIVNEYIKIYAYENRQVASWDQVYIFAKQQRLEDRVLRAGVKVVVSDSPLYLQCFYTKKFNGLGWEELTSLAKKHDDRYPSLNLLVKRHNGTYDQHGRWQTYEQALEVDKEIEAFLQEYKIPYFVTENDPEEVVILTLHRLVEMGLRNKHA